jgi:hypothetical protein
MNMPPREGRGVFKDEKLVVPDIPQTVFGMSG